MQRAVAAQRADVLADVLIGRLGAPARPQRPVELQPLRGTEQLAGQHARRVGDDRCGALRAAMGAHRDVVLAVGRGRDRIDAGRERQRLVLRHQRRRQHLHDHHARVQARVRRQEAGQAAQVGVDQVLDAPFADARQVGERRRRAGRPPGRSAGRGSCRRRSPRSVSAKTSGLSVAAFISRSTTAGDVASARRGACRGPAACSACCRRPAPWRSRRATA